MRRVEIIAEIGWNHMGDIDLAKEMICSAKTAGADVVKFQYWDPKYLKPGAWDSDGRRDIYNNAALTEDKICQLIDFASSEDCDFLISVFGTRGAKFIADIGLKKIKIPSHETTNIALIEFCVDSFDRVYFSAGASTVEEVYAASNILREGKASYNLMHCVSSYPCAADSANLQRINWLRGLCDEVGYSDHTSSTIIPAAAVSLGCTVVEKHFTTDKGLPGRDNKFALDPVEFKEMCRNIREVESAILDRGLDFQPIEKDTVDNYRGRWEPADYD